MLPLLERVVGHLERVQRVTDKTVVDRDVALDHDRFGAYVLDLFDRATDDENDVVRPGPSHWCWVPTYLRAFVEELHWGLLDGVGARWPAEERFEAIEAGLSHASRLEGSATRRPSPARARLLGPLVEHAQQHIGLAMNSWRNHAPWNVAASYCEHLGLTRASTACAVVSPAGAPLIRLRGLDRLRWLLAVETSLATSAQDTWYVDLGSVQRLAAGTSWTFTPDDREGHLISDSTFARWTELGALARWEDDYDIFGYDLTAVGRELFGEFAHNGSTSFRLLIRALLEDEREQILAAETEPGSDPSDRATSATLRHARMVAHEVRNALLPVQHALKKIWASPTMTTAELSDPRRRIEDGLARLHRFVDDSLLLTPPTTEEVASFPVMEVIDEARRQCVPGPEAGIQIETRPASASPRCRGHRGRLVLAVLNLLRNAVQVGGLDVRIHISVDARESYRVRISVRDDGPGVCEAQRDTIFANGVSHRNGGSGHGLSFVRHVIETEMGGHVRLASSPGETGACFELELPTVEDDT